MIPGGGWEFFSTPCPDRLWGLPGAFSLGVKRPRREADHSLSCSAELKSMCGATPPLPLKSSWRGAQLSTGTNLPLPFTFYQASWDILHRRKSVFKSLLEEFIFRVMYHMQEVLRMP
jgi:hypothetical protein